MRKPVITRRTGAAPDNHARAIPERGLTRARRGSDSGGDRRPAVCGGVIFCSGADWVPVRIRAAPDDELFARPNTCGAEPWCRSISLGDCSPDAGARVKKLPIPQWTETRVNPAPDKQVGAIPARGEEEAR